jgi:hypothetical protein
MCMPRIHIRQHHITASRPHGIRKHKVMRILREEFLAANILQYWEVDLYELLHCLSKPKLSPVKGLKGKTLTLIAKKKKKKKKKPTAELMLERRS